MDVGLIQLTVKKKLFVNLDTQIEGVSMEKGEGLCPTCALRLRGLRSARGHPKFKFKR
jgi:hypothetical protein